MIDDDGTAEAVALARASFALVSSLTGLLIEKNVLNRPVVVEWLEQVSLAVEQQGLSDEERELTHHLIGALRSHFSCEVSRK